MTNCSVINLLLLKKKMQEHYSQPIEVDYDGMGSLQVENFLLHKKCYRTFLVSYIELFKSLLVLGI